MMTSLVVVQGHVRMHAGLAVTIEWADDPGNRLWLATGSDGHIRLDDAWLRGHSRRALCICVDHPDQKDLLLFRNITLYQGQENILDLNLAVAQPA